MGNSKNRYKTREKDLTQRKNDTHTIHFFPFVPPITVFCFDQFHYQKKTFTVCGHCMLQKERSIWKIWCALREVVFLYTHTLKHSFSNQSLVAAPVVNSGNKCKGLIHPPLLVVELSCSDKFESIPVLSHGSRWARYKRKSGVTISLELSIKLLPLLFPPLSTYWPLMQERIDHLLHLVSLRGDSLKETSKRHSHRMMGRLWKPTRECREAIKKREELSNWMYFRVLK